MPYKKIKGDVTILFEMEVFSLVVEFFSVFLLFLLCSIISSQADKKVR